MPAAAALSSSRRQRNKSSGRGAGLSRSNRSLGGSSHRGLGSSQRNLMRPPPNTARRRGEEILADSMPTLLPGRDNDMDSIRSSLEDSSRSNPELYLDQHEILNESFNVELRQQQTPQHGEAGDSQSIDQGGGNKNVQHGESTPPRNHALRRRPFLTDNKDSFNENVAAEPTTPIEDGRIRMHPCLKPLNNARKFAGSIINDDRVQNTVLLLIVINAIMMGVATFPAIKGNPDIISKFEICDQIFLILFTIESSMQLIYHGWTLFKDGFLVFDLLIVVMSWALTGAQVFRAFRIFRAMRLITRIDTLKNLVLALFSVVPKMTAIFMLLMLIFYIFAVMFTTLFKGLHDDELVEYPYFETLYDSLFTLFQMMTLDEWSVILFQIMPIVSWAPLPFVVFIIITGFVVVNLIIAVICDAVHVLGNEKKAGLHGYDSEDYASDMEGDLAEGDANNSTVPGNTAEYRLHQLQQQLDDMVLVQDQMKTTIEVLIRQLRENATREAALLPIEENSGEEKTRFRTPSMPPTDSLENTIPRSRTLGLGSGTDLLGSASHIRVAMALATELTMEQPESLAASMPTDSLENTIPRSRAGRGTDLLASRTMRSRTSVPIPKGGAQGLGSQ